MASEIQAIKFKTKINRLSVWSSHNTYLKHIEREYLNEIWQLIKIKRSTYQYGKQETEQFQGSAYVVEIRLVVLHCGQEFVEPGQLQLRVRPEVWAQRHLQEHHTFLWQHLSRGARALVHLFRNYSYMYYHHA